MLEGTALSIFPIWAKFDSVDRLHKTLGLSDNYLPLKDILAYFYSYIKTHAPMKPLYFLFILFFCHFNSICQKTLTNGIYILDGGKSNWYDNEFFVRFFDEDSLIFGQLMFPDSIKNDSLGQYLNELTYVKRAYQRKKDKISFVEEMIHDSKIIEYKILLTSDSTFWLSCDDKTLKKFEVPLRFKFINVDYLDQNVMFIDPHVYKIISDMPHPNSTFLNMNIKVTDAIRQIEASKDYENALPQSPSQFWKMVGVLIGKFINQVAGI
ncbi:MAG: hypothetical protein IPP37_15320 [Saprospiraceae bacterium]|nr:hypothetical protein [Saprospiraceae bacterium]